MFAVSLENSVADASLIDRVNIVTVAMDSVIPTFFNPVAKERPQFPVKLSSGTS